MRRTVVAVLAVALSSVAAAPPDGSGAADGCQPPLLVLAAMPLELDPLLAAAEVAAADVVRADDRTFFPGRIGDHEVVLAMTGVGMVNAEQTVDTAFATFPCGFSAMVFSGVAGSIHAIGDVAIPQRWTLDDGDTWVDADPAMLGLARSLVERVDLSDTVPVGDDACLCPGVDTLDTPVVLAHQPQLYVGGDGTTSDMFGGEALPCVPGGGDVFGCQPCLAPGSTLDDIVAFASDAPSFFSPGVLTDFLQPPAETTDTYVSQDMESAAAAAAAAGHGLPFLVIRGVSDGQGDPLGLPGFPFQFFAYRHLAANNAADVALAFLDAWPR